MGALHAGHVSLLTHARTLAGKSGTVIATVFVNPSQFGPREDFSRYPRPFKRDQMLCRTAGVDLLFAPATDSLYPPEFSTWVEEISVAEDLCGAARPGHFRGVCTIVLKLFNLCRPDTAVFGIKDFQQCAVIARMVRDLNVPVRLVFAPTVREEDGLALSSRNTYLSEAERAQAPVLYAALREARDAVQHGEIRAATINRLLQRKIAAAPLARIDYIAIVNSETLQPVREIAPKTTAALAVFFGKTRLIDNIPLTP
jgi:pantoate--beta-alanine ligase